MNLKHQVCLKIKYYINYVASLLFVYQNIAAKQSKHSGLNLHCRWKEWFLHKLVA